MRTLIVFSHLRWDFVFQRPQHVMTHLAAQGFRVLFVEEPRSGNATPFLERYSRARHIEVLRPRTTVDAQGFDDAQFDELGDLLLEYLDDFGIDDYFVWFYTPLPMPLLRVLEPRAVIYDCMDAGRVKAFFGQTIKEVTSDEVALMSARERDPKTAKESARIKNDYVFALIGGEKPTKFLENIGIKIG